MKSLVKLLFAVGVTTVSTGCEKFLDINTNPNNPTSVTPDAQLANALTVTAANYTGGLAGGNNYNSYASFAAGFWTKSGTVSGFSTERTYLYNNTYYQTLFNSTYDNLEDYQQIQDGAVAYPNHAAIARIMKVYNYLLLVDQFGDIPYTQALKGIANTTPTYDKADAIYKDLVEQLKGAVRDINAVPATALAVANEDVVFNGGATGMLRWKQFANSLRLRILLRESSTNNGTLNDYVKQEMAKLQADATAADGFIARDVVVQPTYTANANQQNPFYDRYGFAPGASRAQGEYSFILPTNFLINQYLQNKDPRITQYYRVGQRNVPGTTTAVAQYTGGDLGEGTSPQFDPTDGASVGSRFLQGGTFLRAATVATPIMLLSEHLFSKAEAETRNLFIGGDAAAKVDFLDGIKSSFVVTYRDAATVPATLATATSSNVPGIAQYNTYITANAGNALVDYDAATTTTPDATAAVYNGMGATQYTGASLTTPVLAIPRTVSKAERILYQKYLAENTLASTEALNDYRRTGLPKFKLSRGSGGRPLPYRLYYPQTETSTNSANVPVGVDQTVKLFWQN